MTLTRAELELAYTRPQSRLSAFRICLPKGDKGEGVCLEFKRRKYSTTDAPPQIMTQEGGKDALALWKSMITVIAAKPAKRVFLLFDTPLVSTSESLVDQRGLWTGSGEASSTYLLGQHLSQLNRQVRVKRWQDLSHPELVGKFNCLIMLGSSLNPGLKRLRTRDSLIALQHFHFEAAISKRSRGCIYKGTLFESLSNAAPPYEHKEATADELEVDYALISFFADLDFKQSVVSMAGITTVGTLAAASFMCSDKYVRDLKKFVRKRCRCDLENGICSFEVLLKMNVKDGLPRSVTLIDAVI